MLVSPSALAAVVFAACTVHTHAAGCYPAWTSGGTIAAGSLRSNSVTTTATKMENCSSGTSGCVDGKKKVETSTTTYTNYACVNNANSAFCGSAGYEPGTANGNIAWTATGTCDNGVAPVYTTPAAWSGGPGCPGAYVAGTAYAAADVVAVLGTKYHRVFKCASEPTNQFCGMSGYEPGTGLYSSEAWTDLGSCSGSLAPTDSPNFDALKLVGACPPKYSSGKAYTEGDEVSKEGFVYKCNALPNGLFCPSAGYEPGTDNPGMGQTPYWKTAWTLAGYCDGSMGPTSSPSFDFDNIIGACPDNWEAKVSPLKYEEGDMVSVTISKSPERKYAYTCKAFPYSGYCGQFAPNVWGGDLGWTFAGPCSGSLGPTTSPQFVKLAKVDGPVGCPAEFSKSKMDYAYGDRVSIKLDADRAVVYQCKTWPDGDHCQSNSENIRNPAAEFGDMAWTLIGQCSGSMAPTPAPVAYNSGAVCTYTKTVVTTNCAKGSAGCSCTANSPPGTYCTKTDTITLGVPNYLAGSTYANNDVVRINGIDRFKCKFSGWCSNKAYRPDGKLWAQAWSTDGVCATPGPTPSPSPGSSQAPSISVSVAPSVVPSLKPSEAPSISLAPSDVPSAKPTTSLAPSDVPSAKPTTTTTCGDNPENEYCSSDSDCGCGLYCRRRCQPCMCLTGNRSYGEYCSSNAECGVYNGVRKCEVPNGYGWECPNMSA